MEPAMALGLVAKGRLIFHLVELWHMSMLDLVATCMRQFRPSRMGRLACIPSCCEEDQ
jgi:hypothetical protein